MPGRQRWFKAKEYGWGWYPASWQGWLIVLAYLLIAIALSAWCIGSDDDLVLACGMLLAILTTFVLILVSYRTGEAPRWLG